MKNQKYATLEIWKIMNMKDLLEKMISLNNSQDRNISLMKKLMKNIFYCHQKKFQSCKKNW